MTINKLSKYKWSYALVAHIEQFWTPFTEEN